MLNVEPDPGVDLSGKEQEFEIVLTFESPETQKKYVVYKEPGESDDVMAAVYDETGEGSGNLLDIETEEEFQMVQDLLDAFYDDDEETEESE